MPKRSNVNEDSRDIAKVLAAINKSLKTNLTFGNADDLQIGRISTGMPAFDKILGGGLPRQSVIELFGKQSTGKTYLAQRAIASAQSQGYMCAFIDAEHSYEPEWAKLSGINVDDLIVSRPDTGEKALDILLALCESHIDVVALDSIEQNSIGLQARLMNKLFRKLPPMNKNTAVILINQTRAGIGGYITRDSLPGGRGQEFFSRIMVRVKRSESIEDRGFYIEVTTEKNKTFTPNLSCTIPFYYSGEIDETYELFSTALDSNIVVRSGPQYTFDGASAIGKEGFLSLMKDDVKLMARIKKEVEEIL
jgi:recombination protein RecA